MTKLDSQKWSRTLLFSGSLIGFIFIGFKIIQILAVFILMAIAPNLLRNHSELLVQFNHLTGTAQNFVSALFNSAFRNPGKLISVIIGILLVSILLYLTSKEKYRKYKWLKYVTLIASVLLINTSTFGQIVGLFGLTGSVLMIHEDV